MVERSIKELISEVMSDINIGSIEFSNDWLNNVSVDNLLDSSYKGLFLPKTPIFGGQGLIHYTCDGDKTSAEYLERFISWPLRYGNMDENPDELINSLTKETKRVISLGSQFVNPLYKLAVEKELVPLVDKDAVVIKKVNFDDLEIIFLGGFKAVDTLEATLAYCGGLIQYGLKSN